MKVGFFDSITRAGEDTDWIKRLNSHNLKIKNTIYPVYYKGLFNISYMAIFKKWFRNYYYSSHLPHMSLQKNFYTAVLFFIILFLVLNINFLIIQWQSPNNLYFPHVTKIFLVTSLIFYTLIRGLILPMRKKIDLKYLFPWNFFFVTVFSISLDIVKIVSFFSTILGKLLNINTRQIMK